MRAASVVMFEIMLLKFFFRFRCRTLGRASQMDCLTRATEGLACCTWSEFRTN